MNQTIRGYQDFSNNILKEYLIEENEGGIKKVLHLGRHLIIALSHKIIHYNLDNFIVVNQVNSNEEIQNIEYAAKAEKVNKDF